MLVALAFVPSPPLLLTALGGGPELLRAACQQAISALDEYADHLVVVGAAPTTGRMTGTIDATAYGAPGQASADPLPLSLAVGATLVGDRPHELYGVGPHDHAGPLMRERTGLLVVGDGSARRSLKAPGHLDPRAEAFDQHVEKVLADGDPAALLGLDADLAQALLAGGLPAWQLAAAAALGEISPQGAAPHGWRGQVHYAEAPYGVFYPVATWLPVP